MAAPMPATARRVVNSFTEVKPVTEADVLLKKIKKTGVKIVDGKIDLHKNYRTASEISKAKKKKKILPNPSKRK